MKLIYTFLQFFISRIENASFSKLYRISDILNPIVRSCVQYRKKIIIENLTKSFPEKDSAEIASIAKKFYRHFTDLFFEVIKLGNITEEEICKRVTVSGDEVFTQLAEKKKGVVVVMNHSGNWEWISQRVCFTGRCFEYTGVVAKEVSNPYFDTYFTSIRMRLQQGHANIIPFHETARHLAAIRHKTSMIITIADQTPHVNQIQYRTRFMNQDSGVFLGPERIAKSLDYAVVYCHSYKKDRGLYHINFELITESPKESPQFEITDKHVGLLEKDIIKQPEIWLWSHRRWKY